MTDPLDTGWIEEHNRHPHVRHVQERRQREAAERILEALKPWWPGATIQLVGNALRHSGIFRELFRAEDKQGQWSHGYTEQRDKADRVMSLHAKSEGPGGMTDGFCAECEHLWPCPTYHVAAGWGLDSFYDCEDARWCSHAGVKM